MNFGKQKKEYRKLNFLEMLEVSSILQKHFLLDELKEVNIKDFTIKIFEEMSENEILTLGTIFLLDEKEKNISPNLVIDGIIKGIFDANPYLLLQSYETLGFQK